MSINFSEGFSKLFRNKPKQTAGLSAEVNLQENKSSIMDTEEADASSVLFNEAIIKISQSPEPVLNGLIEKGKNQLNLIPPALIAPLINLAANIPHSQEVVDLLMKIEGKLGTGFSFNNREKRKIRSISIVSLFILIFTVSCTSVPGLNLIIDGIKDKIYPNSTATPTTEVSPTIQPTVTATPNPTITAEGPVSVKESNIDPNAEPKQEIDVEKEEEETKKFSQVLSTEAFEYMKETEEVIYDGHNWVINPEKDNFKWSGDMHVLVLDSATAEINYIKFAPNQTMVLFSKNNEILVFYGGDKDGYGQKIPIEKVHSYSRTVRSGEVDFSNLQSKRLLFLQGNDTINEAVLIEVIEWLRVFKKKYGFDGMDIFLYTFERGLIKESHQLIDGDMTEEDIIQLVQGEIAEEVNE